MRGVLANRAAAPRDRSANAADTAGSIALGSRSAAARLRSLGAVWRGIKGARGATAWRGSARVARAQA
ncbi:MAG TPA: hypothetical protein VGP95_18890, partial [Gemmatimonadaceae bacterium]|nr:hypothetical protein [Gemmatimonadaceae bacterium]